MASGELDGDFAALIAELAAFRDNRLQRQPSDRTLAKAAGVRPATVGDWLRGARFPQQMDPLLRLVRAVRVQAERAGLSGDPAMASLFDEQRWRDAYEARVRAAIAAGVGTGAFAPVDPALTATYILTALNGLVGWYQPDGRLSARTIADAFADLSVRAVQMPGGRP